ncbi:MAG: LCP family protein [Oscillospiraceae bacterium]|nr:LCP family protein [Oscillospiraceae bacterium]
MEEMQVGTPEPEEQQLTKKGTMGWITFGTLLLSMSVLLYVGISSVSAYLKRSIGAELIRLATTGALVAAILAGIAVILAVVTFFLKRQKKGLAIVSLIFSLLIVLLSGTVLYFYHYMFGAVSHDAEFEQLHEAELHIIQPDVEGKVDFEIVPEVEVIDEEEVKEQIQLQELDWEYLQTEDMPEEALAVMNGRVPIKAGYLHPDAAQIENYLLFGLDRVGSSDSVMIMSFDRVHKKIKLISLARDSYVRIPEWGSYTKLTYAYSAGGAKTAVGTVNYNYRLNVKDYVTVRMEEIAKIVDLVGGAEVDLDYDEINYMNAYGHYGLKYGKNLLNGAAAETYSRMRSSSRKDTEANRTSRQREVLLSMFRRAKETPVTLYPELIRRGMELCTTSLGSEEILSMLMEAVLQGYEVENYALIDMVEYWAGKFGPRNYVYFVYDLDGAADVLYKTIYEDLYISGYYDEKQIDREHGDLDAK